MLLNSYGICQKTLQTPAREVKEKKGMPKPKKSLRGELAYTAKEKEYIQAVCYPDDPQSHIPVATRRIPLFLLPFHCD